MTILLSLCSRFLFCYPKISHWQSMLETQPSNGIMLIKKALQIPIPFFPITGKENSLLWLLRQKCIFQKDLFILGVLDTLSFLAFQRKVNPTVYFLSHFSFFSLLVFTPSLKHTGSASCERQLFAETNVHSPHFGTPTTPCLCESSTEQWSQHILWATAYNSCNAEDQFSDILTKLIPTR